MTLHIPISQVSPQALNTALSGAGLAPVTTVRQVSEDVAHAVLEDGAVLVVHSYPAGFALVYRPEEYAHVDPTRVRDPHVAATWDVRATLDALTPATVPATAA